MNQLTRKLLHSSAFIICVVETYSHTRARRFAIKRNLFDVPPALILCDWLIEWKFHGYCSACSRNHDWLAWNWCFLDVDWLTQ